MQKWALQKIKNLKSHNFPPGILSKSDLISWLKRTVEEDTENSSKSWALAHKNCLPTLEFYILMESGQCVPCYADICGKECNILFVAHFLRRQGRAQFMVSALSVEYAFALPSSVNFWKSVGFKCKKGDSFGSLIEMRKKLK